MMKRTEPDGARPYRSGMANTFRLHRGAVICDYDLTGRQVKCKVSGPITQRVMAGIATDLSRVGERLLAKSFVLDLRPSMLAVPYEQLLMAPTNMGRAMRALPLAVIAPDASVELFREYAWAQAKLGVVRGVFEEMDRARAWAQKKEGCLYSRTPESAR